MAQLERTFVIFCAFIVICDCYSPSSLTRSLRTEFVCDSKYPLCHASEDASYPNLIHVTAAGPNDTLHYFISTIGVPTLLVARTSTKAKVYINQDHLMTDDHSQLGNNTITFTPDADYVYAVMFPMVYEYNDTKDTADMTKIPISRKYWKLHDLYGLQWMPSMDLSDPDNHIIHLNISTNNTFNNNTDPFFFAQNGSFGLKFQFKSKEDRNENLPHLEFTANNTQVSVVFDNITTSFEKSRFGMELLVVTSDPAKKPMHLTKDRNLDDEHTPGVFEMVDWTTRGPQQSSGAYLQWKPVCYKENTRNLNAATKQFYYDLVHLNGSLLDEEVQVSLAYAYFGSALFTDNYTMAAANVSFGLTADKFYRGSNFTVWTFSVGFGTPPSDQLSLMVIMVISVGLGLPAMLIIFGGLCVCIRKQKHKKEDLTSSYTRIQ